MNFAQPPQTRGGFEKIERTHLPVRSFRVVVGHDGASIEVGRQRLITGVGKPFAHSLDLILQAPPFLDDNKAGPVGPRRFGEITGSVLAV